MNVVVRLFDALSGWMAPYTDSIALALIATLLFIYGSDINRFIRRKLKSLNIVIRASVFIVVCAFGYGTVTVLAARYLGQMLDYIGSPMLAPMVVVFFVIVGVLAEGRNQI